MERARLRCKLVIRDGASRRVGTAGALLGRQRDCDVVTLDPSASRRHALVRLTVAGAEVVPLGNLPVVVNGVSTDRATELADGDELEIPGLALTVVLEAQRPDPKAAARFVLERVRGGRFGIPYTPFSIGGGERDDLIVKRWPPAVLTLLGAQGELFVELRVGQAEKNGVALEPGALEALGVGDRLSCRGEAFAIHGAEVAATTTVSAKLDVPRRVEIEMLPRGGRIVFEVAAGTRAVYLADRRFDLLVALLRPPAGLRAGDLVPDDVVRTIVWPRKTVGRPELNTFWCGMNLAPDSGSSPSCTHALSLRNVGSEIS